MNSKQHSLQKTYTASGVAGEGSFTVIAAVLLIAVLRRTWALPLYP